LVNKKLVVLQIMNDKEEFLMKNSLDGGLFQSEDWGNFQGLLKNNFYIIKSEKNQALIIENKLPIVGSYFYVPRGPVFSSDEKDNLILARKIKNKAQEKKVGWFRVEPQKKENLKYFEGLIFKSKKNHQPAETLMLDLNKKLENILAEMKQKTRYNVKLAQKRGVEIRIAKSEKDIDFFYELVKETSKRDKVKFHKKDYYQKIFKSISKENLEFLLATKNSKIIGGILVSYFGGVAIYLHGASSSENRNLMANYLLQWEAIKSAKKKGMSYYDFFGIAVSENKKKWEGITRFKKGFASEFEPVIFPGCYDLVLNPVKYFIYRVLQVFNF